MKDTADAAHARRTIRNTMTVQLLWAALAIGIVAAGCAGRGRVANHGDTGPFIASGLPALSGQAATCAGPREKTFTLDAREATIDLGMGIRFNAWTYNGRLPGPVLEACEGDRVKIVLTNHADTSHGLDSHALRTDMKHFGPVAPGKSMALESTADTPGVYMYHCASGPVTDLHVKSGLNGAMIVYPRKQPWRPARELVVVESGVYGERDATGLIPGTDPVRVQKNDPALMMFNGRLEHAVLPVHAGDLVRAYIVNVGPGVSAIHVMGTILDTVYDGGSTVRNVQTYGIPAGSGAAVEFSIPETGMYGLVDHDRLAYVPYGMELTFDATDGADAAHREPPAGGVLAAGGAKR